MHGNFFLGALLPSIEGKEVKFKGYLKMPVGIHSLMLRFSTSSLKHFKQVIS